MAYDAMTPSGGASPGSVAAALLVASVATAVGAVLGSTTPEANGTVGAGDDTAAITAALATGRTVLFKPGTTYLTTGGHVISTAGQRIGLQGATVKIKDATAVSSGTPSYIFKVTASNVTIENGILDGNRANRTISAAVANVSTLTLSSCNDFLGKNLYIKNGVCDNVYITATDSTNAATFCLRPRFVSCTFDNAYRNNISVVCGQYGKLIACDLLNANGSGPACGIDIEPNSGDASGACRGWVLTGCHAEGNSGYGYSIVGTAGCKDHQLIGCTSRANLTGAVTISADGVEIIGGLHEDYNIATQGQSGMATARGVIDIGSSAGKVTVVGVKLRQVQSAVAASYGIYVHGSAGRVLINKCRVEIASGAVATFIGIAANATECRVVDCEVVGLSTTQILLYINGVRVKVFGGIFDTAQNSAIYCDSASSAVEIDGALFKNITNSTSGHAAIRVIASGAARRITRCTGVNSVANSDRAFRFDGTVTESWGHTLTNFNGTDTADILQPFQPSFSADKGDSGPTVHWNTDESTLYFNTPLTANRVVTLGTVSPIPPKGARFRVVRTAAATGAFNLTVNSKALSAAGQWVDHDWNGSSWIETASGSL